MHRRSAPRASQPRSLHRRRRGQSHDLRWFAAGLLGILALALSSCGAEAPPSLTASGNAWPEADALFRREPRWLGGDGACSCPLGNQRVAWFFGDSFVATSAKLLRSESIMVRNSMAVQTGLDPVTAQMAFAWGSDAAGQPRDWLAGSDGLWYWPGACVRLPQGPLLLFLLAQRPSQGGLGFAAAGWRLAYVAEPDAPPAQWQAQLVIPPKDLQAMSLGTAAALAGDHLYALAIAGDDHAGRMVRWPTSALAARDLAGWQGWNGGAFASSSDFASLIDDAGSEASLHQRAAEFAGGGSSSTTWVHIASRGFGATTVAMRTAPAPQGPWSDAAEVFTPAESRGPKPFVYAAKAHPELATGDGSLALTYAANSFDFADLLTTAGQEQLYWPRFVRLALAPR